MKKILSMLTILITTTTLSSNVISCNYLHSSNSTKKDTGTDIISDIINKINVKPISVLGVNLDPHTSDEKTKDNILNVINLNELELKAIKSITSTTLVENYPIKIEFTITYNHVTKIIFNDVTWYKQSNDLKNQKVSYIYQTKDYSYYAATDNGLYISTDQVNYQKISDILVKSIYETRSNDIYIIGKNNGLYKSINDNDIELVDNFDPLKVSSIYQIDNDDIYVGTDKGLYKSTDSKTFNIMKDVDKNDSISSINEIGGIIYIGTNKGLYTSNDSIKFNLTKNVLTELSINSIDVVKQNNGNDNNWNIYISTNKGLYEYNNISNKFTFLLSDCSVYKVYFGNIILINTNKGLFTYFYNKNDNKYEAKKIKLESSDNKIYTTYSVINITQENNIIYIQTDKGLYYSNSSYGSNFLLNINNSTKDNIIGSDKNTLYLSNYNCYSILDNDNGLFYYDLD